MIWPPASDTSSESLSTAGAALGARNDEFADSLHTGWWTYDDELLAASSAWQCSSMWALWGFMNWILNLLEYWYAARRGEAMKAHKERERFSSWQSQSS